MSLSLEGASKFKQQSRATSLSTACAGQGRIRYRQSWCVGSGICLRNQKTTSGFAEEAVILQAQYKNPEAKTHEPARLHGQVGFCCTMSFAVFNAFYVFSLFA